MIEGKIPLERIPKTFLRHIKKDAGTGSYIGEHSNKWGVTVKNGKGELQTNLRFDK